MLHCDGEVCSVSARSVGDVNVQIIMEKLGGGGHQLAAGAQIKTSDINAVKKQLTDIIDDYFAHNTKTENNHN